MEKVQQLTFLAHSVDTGSKLFLPTTGIIILSLIAKKYRLSKNKLFAVHRLITMWRFSII